MSFRVRFTEEARADIKRLYAFALEHADGDWTLAERAVGAIDDALALLATSPFSCRKAAGGNALLRELIIAFGASGYVALFEIENGSTVTVLAVRHQREDDYH
jgi:plasmid stabilization system protein ParE